MHQQADENLLQKTILSDKCHVMGVFTRPEIVFTKGEGLKLWDSEGREYLDFLGGIAVVLVGHCHPEVTARVSKQAATLVHISNLFHNSLQSELAQRLCELTHMEKVFFANSGAEANECALKIARKWGKKKRGNECYEIITFNGSFHGRTMGTVSATAQSKYQAPFEPLVPGFRYTDRNDLRQLDAMISDKTCAVMLEPIQGESGIHSMTGEFLRGVRALCDESEVLLIHDEIQCGMGRTGKFLAAQHFGVEPDVVTLAKGLGAGFPIGACLARGEAANTLTPGDHGSTFSGQPLACSAALATLDVLRDERLVENAVEVGVYLVVELEKLKSALGSIIAEVRGAGLMVGLDFVSPIAKRVQQDLLASFVIVNATGDHTLRFVPALCVTKEDCNCLIKALHTSILKVAD